MPRKRLFGPVYLFKVKLAVFWVLYVHAFNPTDVTELTVEVATLNEQLVAPAGTITV